MMIVVIINSIVFKPLHCSDVDFRKTDDSSTYRCPNITCYFKTNILNIEGKKTVRNVLSKCLRCKKTNSRHLDTVFAPILLERIAGCNSFDSLELIWKVLSI